MSKLTDKQLIIFSILLFALIYITVHTNATRDFIMVLRPFINGFILAYITGIIATRVEEKLPVKYARGLSILIVYIMFAGIIALLLVYLIPLLVQNVQLFIRKLPDHLADNDIATINHLFNTWSLTDLTPRITNQLLGVSEYALSLTTGIVNIILSFVVSIYVLLTRDSIFTFCHRLGKVIMPDHAEAIRHNIHKSHIVFKQFLLTQLIASLIIGLCAGVVLYLLGVNYASLIGTIIGLLNMIPIFGAIVGVLVSMIILFLTNPSMLAMASFVYLLLLQQIDATILTPKLMGHTLNLNPIVIILVLTLGTTYFGLIGILFAVPFTIILREIAKEKLREP